MAAGRFGTEAALLFGLFALWQYAGSFSVLPSAGGLPGPAGSGTPNEYCTCRTRSACSGSSARIRC